MKISETGIYKIKRPVKAVQFGEGNFLRGFTDYMIDVLNEKTDFNGSVVIVKPIEHGSLEAFHEQDCMYTVLLRGLENGGIKTEKRIITCVERAVSCNCEYSEYKELTKLDTLRFIISNTTEAGIVYSGKDKQDDCPPESFPGKLTKFLYERYKHFCGDKDKGLIILPVELIDDNGAELKRIVARISADWGLERGFTDWTDNSCVFASTLVDRIVTGYPHGEDEEIFRELGYSDKLLVTGEPFALWVIESEKDISREIPFKEASLPVIFTDNGKRYKQRKVRILNGAHTSMMPVSFLSGNDLVGQSLDDGLVEKFLNETVYNEIIPSLLDELPENELVQFADSVRDRFKNPYIKHPLLSISLNGISKFRTRCLPSLLGFIKQKNTLPKCLTFSLAATAVFYDGTEIRGGALIGGRNGFDYEIRDDMSVLEFFVDNNKLTANAAIKNFLGNKDFWGTDLTEIIGLCDAVEKHVTDIRAFGMRDAADNLLRGTVYASD